MLTTGVFVISVAMTGPALATHKNGQPHGGGGGGGSGATTTIGELTCTTDQIAKFDGTDWNCAPDETGSGGGSSSLLMDSDLPSNEVGKVVTVLGHNTVLAQVSIGGQEALLNVSTLGFLPNPQTLVYLADNCAGPAYLDAGATNPDSFILDPVWVDFDTLDNPVAYGIASPVPTLGMDILSVLIEGSCFPFPFSNPNDVFPVETLDSDLHFTFPPPYTVGDQ